MTGPGPGKIRVRAQVVIVRRGEAKVLEGVQVYLHLKGWSRAPITHIDVEYPGLEELVGGPGRGVYGVVEGVAAGFRFTPFQGEWLIEVRGLGDPILSVFQQGERSYGYAGGKKGGIYIGFKRFILERLEEIAARVYGIGPRWRGLRVSRH